MTENTGIQENQGGCPRACAYLGRYREAAGRAEQLRQKKENMQRLLDHLEIGEKNSTGRVSVNEKGKKAIRARIRELGRQIAGAKKEAETARIEIGMAICKIEDPMVQKALIFYYLDKKSWLEVAAAMAYSQMQVYRFRDAGYAEMEKLLSER